MKKTYNCLKENFKTAPPPPNLSTPCFFSHSQSVPHIKFTSVAWKMSVLSLLIWNRHIHLPVPIGFHGMEFIMSISSCHTCVMIQNSTYRRWDWTRVCFLQQLASILLGQHRGRWRPGPGSRNWTSCSAESAWRQLWTCNLHSPFYFLRLCGHWQCMHINTALKLYMSCNLQYLS